MKMFIDCSHVIEENMPVYPGTEGPTLLQACTLEDVGFREKKWIMYSHTGTHMDAPAHMLAEGKTLDQFSVEKFMGRGMVVDVRECTEKEIPLMRLQSYESILKKVDYVLIQTGWEEYWGSEQYVGNFPALSIEAAKYLMKFNLKGIGVDAISIDLMDTETFPIHKILLENELVIIENLKNMSLLEGRFDFYAFPLNVKDADGSPIRAVAVVEE
jgi:kynurenine formamidase